MAHFFTVAHADEGYRCSSAAIGSQRCVRAPQVLTQQGRVCMLQERNVLDAPQKAVKIGDISLPQFTGSANHVLLRAQFRCIPAGPGNCWPHVRCYFYRLVLLDNQLHSEGWHSQQQRPAGRHKHSDAELFQHIFQHNRLPHHHSNFGSNHSQCGGRNRVLYLGQHQWCLL